MTHITIFSIHHKNYYSCMNNFHQTLALVRIWVFSLNDNKMAAKCSRPVALHFLVIFHPISSKVHIWITLINLSPMFEYRFSPMNGNQDGYQNLTIPFLLQGIMRVTLSESDYSSFILLLLIMVCLIVFLCCFFSFLFFFFFFSFIGMFYTVIIDHIVMPPPWKGQETYYFSPCVRLSVRHKIVSGL